MNAIELTDKTFKEYLQTNKAFLVDFTAEWCPPCRAMGPIIQSLSTEFADKAWIGKLNVDDNPETAAEYHVRNLPTFLLFKNGMLAERIVGAVPKIVLEKKLNALI
jgi:thioredoxin 1